MKKARCSLFDHLSWWFVLIALSHAQTALPGKVEKSVTMKEGGRSVLMREITDPGMSEPRAVVAKALSAQEAAELLARQEVLRATTTIHLSATVFNLQNTWLRWNVGAEEYVACTNVDFNYFRELSTFTSNGKTYALNLGIGDEINSKSISPEKVPVFANSSPQLIVMKGDAKNTAALSQINVLLDYYKREEVSLKASYATRVKTQQEQVTAQAAYEKANLTKSKDIILNYTSGIRKAADVAAEKAALQSSTQASQP
jgi:hypothetical protein